VCKEFRRAGDSTGLDFDAELSQCTGVHRDLCERLLRGVAHEHRHAARRPRSNVASNGFQPAASGPTAIRLLSSLSPAFLADTAR
jgi:hypothetical protein